MEIIINGKPLQFKGIAQLGQMYRYEKIFGHPFDYKPKDEDSVDTASLIELFYAILCNDNPHEVIDFNDYINELDNIFPIMAVEYARVKTAMKPQKKAEETKKKTNQNAKADN